MKTSTIYMARNKLINNHITGNIVEYIYKIETYIDSKIEYSFYKIHITYLFKFKPLSQINKYIWKLN